MKHVEKGIEVRNSNLLITESQDIRVLSQYSDFNQGTSLALDSWSSWAVVIQDMQLKS